MGRFYVEDGRVTTLELGEGAFNTLRFCRDGPMVYNRHDQYVGRSLATYGEYNWHEQDLLLKLFGNTDVVVEVGANLGAHTVGLAKHARLLYAFEPQRLMFQTLCANLALNNLANVRAYHEALGDGHGHVAMPALDPRREANFGGQSVLDRDPGTPFERVPLTKLDDLDLAQCALIKVDVEGMEAAVLRGAQATIRSRKPVLYVENDRREHSAELVELLRGLGYTLYWHTPPLYNFYNHAGVRDNVFGSVVSINMLCQPSRSAPSHNLRAVQRHDDLWSSAGEADGAPRGP